jgi:hypothetical protein
MLFDRPSCATPSSPGREIWLAVHASSKRRAQHSAAPRMPPTSCRRRSSRLRAPPSRVNPAYLAEQAAQVVVEALGRSARRSESGPCCRWAEARGIAALYIRASMTRRAPEVAARAPEDGPNTVLTDPRRTWCSAIFRALSGDRRMHTVRAQGDTPMLRGLGARTRAPCSCLASGRPRPGRSQCRCGSSR